MFSRIKEAKRIISFRESDLGPYPDVVIEQRKPAKTTKAGRTIAYLFEFAFVVLVLARIAGYIGLHLEKLIPAVHSVSLTTLAAAIGIVLTLLLDTVRNDILSRVRGRIKLVELLAPYFGHRLDNTIRVLRG
jgi:hypothetical protein